MDLRVDIDICKQLFKVLNNGSSKRYQLVMLFTRTQMMVKTEIVREAAGAKIYNMLFYSTTYDLRGETQQNDWNRE